MNRIENRLKSIIAGAKPALAGSINTASPRDALRDAVKKNLALTPKKISAAFSESPATDTRPEASVTVKGYPTPLSDFNPVLTANGVSCVIWKRRVNIPGAIIRYGRVMRRERGKLRTLYGPRVPTAARKQGKPVTKECSKKIGSNLAGEVRKMLT